MCRFTLYFVLFIRVTLLQNIRGDSHTENSLSFSLKLTVASTILTGGGALSPLPSQFWNLAWLGLPRFCSCHHNLCVHMYSCPVSVSSFTNSGCYTKSPSASTTVPEPWGRGRAKYVPSSGENSAFSYSLHPDQLRLNAFNGK